MFEYLESEVIKQNRNSLKWHIDEEDAFFSKYYSTYDVDTVEYREKCISYWKKMLCKNEDCARIVFEVSHRNKYARLAIIYNLISNITEIDDLYKIDPLVDITIKMGDSIIAYDYGIALLGMDEIRSEKYLKIAADMGYEKAIQVLANKDNSSMKDEKALYIRPTDFSFASEIVEQGYYLNELGEEYAEFVRILNMDSISVYEVKRCMEICCRSRNIPVSISLTSLTSGGLKNSIMAKIESGDVAKGGGLLNKKIYRALKISHPYPPQRYCDDLFVFTSDGVRFFFVGGSEAIKETNEYSDIMSGNFSRVRVMSRIKFFAGKKPDVEALDKEMQWHHDIFDSFCSLIESV